jgi:hypothetical protein
MAEKVLVVGRSGHSVQEDGAGVKLARAAARRALVLAKFPQCEKIDPIAQPIALMSIANVRIAVSESLHPAAPHHLPGFITAPGESDVLMIGVGIFLIVAVLAVGNFYLHLHSLPERMAHKSQKFQFEIVAVLGLLSLFTHNHLFWVIGLFLAMIDLPDFSTPLRRIAGSVEKMAGVPPDQDPTEPPAGDTVHAAATAEAKARIEKAGGAKSEAQAHA